MGDDFLEFDVGTADLRRGLQAVLPHVQADREAADTHRIRMELRDGREGDAELLMIATDGFTAASYAATARDASCIGLESFDIAPYDVAKILAVFKAGKDDDPDAGESVARVHVTEKLLRIRDVSGLFEGHELELPATPPGQWPNVARLLGEYLAAIDYENESIAAAIVAETRPIRQRIELTGKYLARFAKSAQVIGSPVVIDTDQRALLIQCADVFVGMVNPGRVSDEQQAVYTGRRRAWADSLVKLGKVETARRAGLDDVAERLQEAIRYVGTRQVTTVKALREGLAIGQAEADQLVKDLRAAGLIGPAKRGKAAPALFSPDEIDQAIECVRRGEVWENAPAAEATPPVEDEPAPVEVVTLTRPIRAGEELSGPDWGDVEEGGMETMPDPAEAPVPTSWEADAATAGPFSDVPAPPDPFTDSDGNQWPTVANPFDTP